MSIAKSLLCAFCALVVAVICITLSQFTWGSLPVKCGEFLFTLGVIIVFLTPPATIVHIVNNRRRKNGKEEIDAGVLIFVIYVFIISWALIAFN